MKSNYKNFALEDSIKSKALYNFGVGIIYSLGGKFVQSANIFLQNAVLFESWENQVEYSKITMHSVNFMTQSKNTLLNLCVRQLNLHIYLYLS